MNFRPELAQAILDGRKTMTRRLTSDNPRSPWYEGGCSLKVGRSYAVCPGRGKHAVGRVVVTVVARVRLGRLSDADARAEGFADAAGFEEAWASINVGYDPDALVWAVGFELIHPDDYPLWENGSSAGVPVEVVRS